ncbi:MAG: transglutaminase family protein [Burkholderiales bacterium]|nr:transglutaminase family protein [Burkholderiales bacterium]
MQPFLDREPDMIHTPPGAFPEPGPDYLASTRFLDHATPSVRAWALRTGGSGSPLEKAVRLFYAIRDGWRYDPFSMRLDPRLYVASRVLAVKSAYCLPKAILLAACARAADIPSAIGLSDVVNHLVTEKLKTRLGGRTLFMHHGYAVLHLEGRWVKAAPAFNIELCTRFGVHPTEFDGASDAIFQEFDVRERRHMEYVRDHGMWSDFPYERVETDYRAYYPPGAFGEDDTGERFEDGAPLRTPSPG